MRLHFEGTIVHTPTEDDFSKIVNYCLNALHLKWMDGVDYVDIRKWKLDKEYTCVRIGPDRINYSSREFYEIKNNLIVLSTNEFFDTMTHLKILKTFR